jgi:hypothetical protein
MNIDGHDMDVDTESSEDGSIPGNDEWSGSREESTADWLPFAELINVAKRDGVEAVRDSLGDRGSLVAALSSMYKHRALQVGLDTKGKDIDWIAQFIIKDTYMNEMHHTKASVMLKAIIVHCRLALEMETTIGREATKVTLQALTHIFSNYNASHLYMMSVRNHNFAFTSSITEFSWYDALYIVTQVPSERRWVRARVVEIVEPMLRIQFEKAGRAADCMIPRHSNLIAPLNSKSVDRRPPEDFIKSLAPGLQCDVKDRGGSWYG